MSLRRNTIAVGLAVGAVAVGITFRPAAAVADRDEKAEHAGKVGYVLVPRLLIESARAKAHAKKLNEVRRTIDAKLGGPFRTVGRTDGPDPTEEARREFDGHSDKLLAEMYQEVAIVAAQLAREYGLDAVQTYPVPPGTIDFRQQKDLLGAPGALLYVRRDADLTDEMLRRLDKRFEAEAGEQ
jgi:Skp family chaperone for outer membrane proteins